MRVIPTCIYIGFSAASFTFLSYISGMSIGNNYCKQNLNDWIVLGSLGSIGSFLGSYYMMKK